MGDELTNPFRETLPLKEMTAQELASRVEGCSTGLQILNHVQQQTTLGFGDQIRVLTDRVTALELLVLRFATTDSKVS